MTQSQIASMLGRMEVAITAAERSVELAKRTPFPFMPTMALSLVGSTVLQCHERFAERAQKCHAEALAGLRMVSGHNAEANVLAEVGFCALLVGDAATAKATFERGLGAAGPMRLLRRPELLAGCALAALELGDPAAALSRAEEAVAFAVDNDIAFIVPLVTFVRAVARAANHHREDAERDLEHAAALADQWGLRPLAVRIASEAARVGRAAGKDNVARHWQERGRTEVDAIARQFTDPGLRDLYVDHAARELATERASTPQV